MPLCVINFCTIKAMYEYLSKVEGKTRLFSSSALPDTNALVNATKRLEYKESSILNEVIQASDEEEVIDQHL